MHVLILLTVQKFSFPSISYPCIEQLPPTIAIDDDIPPSFPITTALEPSGVWNNKYSLKLITNVNLSNGYDRKFK
jgi:hypothetical protein